MIDSVIPLYVVTGFLESGKTSFIQYTINQDYFADGENTLLIVCEEGIEEYDISLLQQKDTSVAVIEDEQQLTKLFLEQLNEQYKPERVLLEYNGMWKPELILSGILPDRWQVYQWIMTIDASVFSLYLGNMKPIIMGMAAPADLIIFNRCTEELPLAVYRRNIKAVNRRTELIFENESGEVENMVEDILPFNYNENEIIISEEDFGLWYLDIFDHMERYVDKKVTFTGMVVKSDKMHRNYFIAGRRAMTCCADDIRFIGFVCRTRFAKNLESKQWITLTAVVKHEYSDVYKGPGPVLYGENVEITQCPEEELVYFN